jgi:hypothetical protein
VRRDQGPCLERNAERGDWSGREKGLRRETIAVKPPDSVRSEERSLTPIERFARRATGMAVSVSSLTVAVAAFAGIAVFGVLGFIHRHEPGSIFNVDGEGVPPADFSAALLLAGGALLLLRGRLARDRYESVSWALLGGFLVFMSLDEWRAIHEHLEALTGVDWQVLYLPVVAVGAWMWVAVLWQLSPPRLAVVFFVVGAAAWLGAQAIEAYQWSGDDLVHPGTVVPEEVLEMTGSALFLLGAHMHLRRYWARPTARRPGPRLTEVRQLRGRWLERHPAR